MLHFLQTSPVKYLHVHFRMDLHWHKLSYTVLQMASFLSFMLGINSMCGYQLAFTVQELWTTAFGFTVAPSAIQVSQVCSSFLSVTHFLWESSGDLAFNSAWVGWLLVLIDPAGDTYNK